MKKFFNRLILIAMSVTCTVLFSGCAQILLQKQEEADSSSIITDYKWQGSQDNSLIVCEPDGTFKYYRLADDLTDNYFGGTYEFYMGEDAVTYITEDLSAYGVTKDELETVFDNNEEYDESNFVCFVLNNEVCIMEGENQIESPYETPYYGFCLEEDGTLYLDIANMNTGNYFLYIAK